MNNLERAIKSQTALRKVFMEYIGKLTPQETINLFIDTALVSQPEQWLGEYLEELPCDNGDYVTIKIRYKGAIDKINFSKEFLNIKDYEAFFLYMIEETLKLSDKEILNEPVTV